MVDGSFRENLFTIKYWARQNFAREEYELIWVEYYDKVNHELKQILSKYPNFRLINLNRSGQYHSSYYQSKTVDPTS